jgi:hypothetical protein
MKRIRPRLAVMLLVGALLAAGCGQSSSRRQPSVASVPLIGGTRIAARVRSCDRGVNPYCAVQLVVVGDRYSSSGALQAAERRYLDGLGWTSAQGDSGKEDAADSPGHDLRLVFATVSNDLEGVDLGWIERPRPITHALSTAMFDRAPAISLMLETGSS